MPLSYDFTREAGRPLALAVQLSRHHSALRDEKPAKATAFLVNLADIDIRDESPENLGRAANILALYRKEFKLGTSYGATLTRDISEHGPRYTFCNPAVK